VPEPNPLRIPSVERILSSPDVLPLIESFGREVVKGALGGVLESVRRGETEAGGIAEALRRELESQQAPSLRPLINATGVLIHTNLGRSPIDPALWASAGSVVERYSNLEFSLSTGERGSRQGHVESVATQLFGCEAALLVNNNAAGTLLVLAALASRREVLVSRGELVEIGGSFRVPDVIQQGGAKLREVGTTNRTRASDYASAVTRRTAAILRVHRSNFDIVGFTESPSLEELAEVARSRGIPLLYDEGSGCVVGLDAYGVPRQETVREALAFADVVTCSTDKLIGATQGGLILGRRSLVDLCKAHPLMRALRAGKESYAVVTETLRAFLSGRHESAVPLYRMLSASLDSLRARAVSLGVGEVIETRAVIGGGTTPNVTVPSIGVRVGDHTVGRRLLDAGIVATVRDGACVLDLRSVFPDEDGRLRDALLRV
jgi:L-seryl-tRNA(Ser) seleniumtransferase